MGNSTALIAFIVLFVAIAIFYTVYMIRRREITFEGVVIDKDIIETQSQNTSPMNGGGITFGNRGGVMHTYRIKVKTDAGKEINYQVTEGKYEIIKIGDRVSKAKGTTDVEIIQSIPGSPPVAQPPVQQPPTNPAPPPQTFV